MRYDCPRLRSYKLIDDEDGVAALMYRCVQRNGAPQCDGCDKWRDTEGDGEDDAA